MKLNKLALSLLLAAAGCYNPKKSETITENSKPSIPNEFLVNAVLYNYFTAEYKALTFQAFNSAKDQLELLKLKNPKRTDMAVILDIDETILDNSPYQAQLYLLNASYDSLWNEWCNLKAARPVPGAVEFLKFADSLGYNIFYITNRKLKTVYQSTLENLQKVGFPQTDSLHLLMRTEGNNKEERRQKLDEKYEVIMLVGDNIGDFYEDTNDYKVRDLEVINHKNEFGKKLIVLPNAMYGNWVNSLNINSKKDVDSLISIMTLPFNK